jgi:hypothetical protein
VNEILAEREVFQAAAACTHLSRSARALYQRLAEASTRMRYLLSQCQVIVRVTEEPSVCRREMTDGQETIVLSAELLSREQRLAQQPVLLCENLDDCDFLECLGVIYGTQRRLPDRIQLSTRNGGGSTTASVYEDILKAKAELCLCICDSDLKYEGDTSEGDTARALRAAHVLYDPTLACLHVLRCQEAENLIPASILADVYISDVQKLNAVPDLDNIQSNRTHQLWRYYDIKNGIRVFEFVSSANQRYVASWSRVFGGSSDIVEHNCAACAKYRACERKSDCTAYLARGFGSTVLRDTVTGFFTKRSCAEIIRRLPQAIAGEWEIVGRLVWAWGMAGCRMAA